MVQKNDLAQRNKKINLAGLPGFEPGTSVLETDVLPLKLQTLIIILNALDVPVINGAIINLSDSQ